MTKVSITSPSDSPSNTSGNSRGSRGWWRAASRLAALWMLAAVVSAPGPVVAAHAEMWSADADSSVLGRNQIYTARHQDTLLDIARRFSMGLAEIRLANPGVDTWLPGEGTEIRLPSRFVLPDTSRSGLVVNVAEMRVYFYPGDGSVVRTWPISIGRVGWDTPLGETSIVRKKAYPIWYPPESIREEAAMDGNPLPRVVGPGPDNPLGSRALYLGFPQYLIHGTNKPFSIGMRVSHGCVRMYPEHIEELYELVKPGTPVTLVHQGVKAGWSGGRLYLEVHPVAGVPDEDSRPSMTEVVSSLVAATPESGLPVNLDWKRVEEALATANGIPVAVASRPIVLAASGEGESAD
ncbi:MAG: L,D-transpeptidase family protein [Thiotrichales bacterium]|nr:L,D-transpeptidase family protein [Thiotrichales bacterium]MCY4348792.1 L,D-transpeptidase family protein [Thiotrichales bacterium]